jgi:MFS superfamily sulfate permease-like transporter
MVDIQTVSIAIASVSVVLAAIYYVLHLGHQRKIRQTDLIMRLYSEWKGKELNEAWLKVWNLEFKDFNDFVKKYGRWYSETEVYIAFRMVCLFFEEMGVLLHRKLLDIGIVADLFTISTKNAWEKVKPIVEGLRALRQMGPLTFGYFEYLYNEMKKREQKLQQLKA